MFKKQLRKKFLKALSRATLILLLPVNVGITIPPAAAAQSPNAKHAPGWEKVAFDETKDIKSLVKTYPFLKPVMQDMQDTDKATSTTTQVFVSDMRSKKKHIRLLFVHLAGSLYCGSAGCSLSIYADDGKGYKKALDGVINEPIYISKGGDKVSLLFCTDKGQTQWDLKNNTFVFQGPFSSKNPPACN